ncbi:MAG TPA: metalloregulator ArsR/SmtB family transcription factor [Vicinamibacterales bacterium]|nr:metalloregulator ArsR/SmtB family transcription factor [Vicinamibacterales bacterium]
MDGLNAAPPAPLLDRLSVLSDPVRPRVLLLLEAHELTVTELCAVLQLPQSTMSRHLKALADSGWIASRSEGTRHLYALAPDGRTPAAAQLWALVKAEIAGSVAARQDAHRLDGILAERQSRSREFFASSAGQWDRMREDLFGTRFHLTALLGLLDEDWAVGDLGCGTGQVSAAVAPFVRTVVGVDSSPEMLDAARSRLAGIGRVELKRGNLEALPIADGVLDAAIAMLVLHHLPEPGQALAEMARVLKPGGRLLVADMLPHDRDSYRQQMGHVWLGFSEAQVARALEAADFTGVRIVPLPADPVAKGPALFVATARRAAVRAS